MTNIIKARQDLVKRAVNNVRGVSLKPDPDFFASVHAVIANVEDDFLADLMPRVIEVRNICRTAADDPHYLGLFRQMVIELAYDVKGQAGLFGHDLATKVAGSLLSFISDVAPETPQHVALVSAYIDALYLLLVRKSDKELKAMSATIIGGLQLATAQVKARSASNSGDLGSGGAVSMIPTVMRPAVTLFPDVTGKVVAQETPKKEPIRR